jgi:hypothetical protein
MRLRSAVTEITLAREPAFNQEFLNAINF